MNRLNLTARLVAAAAAATVTLSLFGAVVSIAEPQQSVLMAKNQRLDHAPGAPSAMALAAPAAIAVAMNDTGKTRSK